MLDCFWWTRRSISAVCLLVSQPFCAADLLRPPLVLLQQWELVFLLDVTKPYLWILLILSTKSDVFLAQISEVLLKLKCNLKLYSKLGVWWARSKEAYRKSTSEWRLKQFLWCPHSPMSKHMSILFPLTSFYCVLHPDLFKPLMAFIKWYLGLELPIFTIVHSRLKLRTHF